MIDPRAIPTQRQSPGPHTRDYGCCACSYAAIIQIVADKILAPTLLRDTIVKATNAPSTLGEYNVILDNDKALSEPGWYRVFVTDKHAWMRLVSEALGIQTETVDLFTCANWKEIPETVTGTSDEFVVIVYRTKYYTGGVAVNGQHFALGRYNPTTKKVEEIYNPWPGLSTLGVKEYRFLRARKV